MHDAISDENDIFSQSRHRCLRLQRRHVQLMHLYAGKSQAHYDESRSKATVVYRPYVIYSIQSSSISSLNSFFCYNVTEYL